jgi:GAF domain
VGGGWVCGTENRVTDFADLVATAIANADARDALRASRDELHELAELQAALRQVATLVARAVEPSELFKAVAEEMSRHLGAELTALWRYQPDGSAILVATNVDADPPVPVGTRMTLEGENLLATVLQTGRPARQDSIETANANGSTVGLIREIGLRTAVGAPIVVDRRVWGPKALVPKQDCCLWTLLGIAFDARNDHRLRLAATVFGCQR